MRILFVDDEPNLLNGLQRMLRRMAGDWHMRFLSSGQAALELLARECFDVIVSDVRMPGMDGVQLLTLVQQRHPEIVRIILSGQADEAVMLRAVGPAHQCLAKPCDSEQIQGAVRRTLLLRNALRHDQLRQAVARLPRLPSLPELYQQIMAELRGPDPSIGAVARIVAQDLAMSAKVLQLVNSAFFGLGRKITDPARAVLYLGLDTLRGLALHNGAFEQLEGTRRSLVDDLWEHSAIVGGIARRLALAEKTAREEADGAFQAGFLHDIGRLVVAANIRESDQHLLRSVPGDSQSGLDKERDLLGVTHAEVGGYLLGIWGLPHPVVEAVMFHHSEHPVAGGEFPLLHAVQFAEAFAGMEHPERDGQDRLVAARPHLTVLGDRLDLWWRTAMNLEMEEYAR